MYLFGHLGIGSKLVSPWSKGLPIRWIFVGTLLPDLIDKPLYYGLVLVTGQWGSELGLISGTRTFGHTALFLLALGLLAMFRRSKILAALVLGAASHLLLDQVSDAISNPLIGPAAELNRNIPAALFWPFTGLQFPIMPYRDGAEQLGRMSQPFMLWAEVLGVALLSWEFWKWNHQSEVLTFLAEKRRLALARYKARKERAREKKLKRDSARR